MPRYLTQTEHRCHLVLFTTLDKLPEVGTSIFFVFKLYGT